MLRAFVPIRAVPYVRAAQHPPCRSSPLHLSRHAHHDYRRRNKLSRAFEGVGQALASPITNAMTHYAGLSFMYFTFFYSFFNWWHYKELRDMWDAEDAEDNDS